MLFRRRFKPNAVTKRAIAMIGLRTVAILAAVSSPLQPLYFFDESDSLTENLDGAGVGMETVGDVVATGAIKDAIASPVAMTSAIRTSTP